MKKYLWILWVAILFISCDDTSSNAIDYSKLTTEELLQTGGGIDYLVSQSHTINYAELNERLETEVILANPQHIYRVNNGEWIREVLIGIGSAYCVLMNNNTFRYCYEPDSPPLKGLGYHTYNANDNAIIEMIKKVCPSAQIAAYVDNTLICEYRHNEELRRFLVVFGDWREWVSNTYTRDFDAPTD